MLAIVLAVQQLESHILQPLVMGKAVSLHPVAVILSVAAGSYLAGIPGALFSVPILAVANSSIRYIAGRTWEHDEVLATAGPEGSHAPEPGADTTFTDVHLPGGTPGREGAAPNSGAPGSDAGRGTDA
jgi:hypothetical protein